MLGLVVRVCAIPVLNSRNFSQTRPECLALSAQISSAKQATSDRRGAARKAHHSIPSTRVRRYRPARHPQLDAAPNGKPPRNPGAPDRARPLPANGQAVHRRRRTTTEITTDASPPTQATAAASGWTAAHRTRRHRATSICSASGKKSVLEELDILTSVG